MAAGNDDDERIFIDLKIAQGSIEIIDHQDAAGIGKTLAIGEFITIIKDDNPKADHGSNMGGWYGDMSGAEAVESFRPGNRVDNQRSVTKVETVVDEILCSSSLTVERSSPPSIESPLTVPSDVKEA